MNAFLETYLQDFRKRLLLESEHIRLAEEYLVQVVKSNAIEKTFDKLRYSIYTHNLDTTGFPPTSHSTIHGHIPRWWFLIKKSRGLLDTSEFNLNPMDYGWIERDGHLLPNKYLHVAPEELGKCCKCKSRDRRTNCRSKKCTCRKAAQVCTAFCQRKALCVTKADDNDTCFLLNQEKITD